MFSTRHVVLSLLALALLLSIPAAAQTAIYLGAGPSIYAQASPNIAGNLIVGPVVDSTGTSILTVFEARGATMQSLTYSTMELIRQRVVSVQTGGGTFELAGLAGGGAIVTSTASGGSAAFGGELTWHPKAWPNWGVSASARAVYSPALGTTAGGGAAWQPWAMVHVGYTFRQQK